MATTITDPASGASSGAQSSHTIPSVVVPSGADVFYVAVRLYNTTAASTVSAVTWNSASLTFVGRAQKQFETSDFWTFEVWKLENPTPGTGGIVITPSASVQIGGIAFSVSGVASGTYFRGSPTVSAEEDEDLSYGISGSQSGDVCVLAYYYSTEPESAPTGSGTATLIAQVNGTTFTTGYLRAYSVVANASPITLAVPYNGYGFGGAFGLAFIEDGGGGANVVPIIIHNFRLQHIL